MLGVKVGLGVAVGMVVLVGNRVGVGRLVEIGVTVFDDEKHAVRRVGMINTRRTISINTR
jgi:hypothetical protein